MNTINVIASCSALKRNIPSTSHTIASITEVTTSARFSQWEKRINIEQNAIPARDLYQGGYWSTMTDLSVSKCGTASVDLWVLSAGFGFIHSTTPVTPYSATFTRGNQDSVIHSLGGVSETLDWWTHLIRWNSSKNKAPASIKELAKKNPTTPIIAAISPNYLRAVEEDLCQAREALSNPNLLIIISAGTKHHAHLEKNLIPADARLQNLVGGPLTSLNARIAQWIIANTTYDDLLSDKLTEKFTSILATLQSPIILKRKILSDDEIKQFILNKLKETGRPSHSRFLKILRSEGLACEQKRFKEIYLNTTQNFI